MASLTTTTTTVNRAAVQKEGICVGILNTQTIEITNAPNSHQKYRRTYSTYYEC